MMSARERFGVAWRTVRLCNLKPTGMGRRPDQDVQRVAVAAQAIGWVGGITVTITQVAAGAPFLPPRDIRARDLSLTMRYRRQNWRNGYGWPPEDTRRLLDEWRAHRRDQGPYPKWLP